MMIEEMVYGSRGNEAYLTLGFKKATLEEFSKLEQRAAIYMVCGKNNEVLYVGETTCLRKRLGGHLSPKSEESERISHVLYAYVKMDRYERHIIEGLLVNKYKPQLNADDDKNSINRLGVSKETELDILHYVRNTKLTDAIIAKAFNISTLFVSNMRRNGTGSYIDLPKHFVPAKEITAQFVADNPITRDRLTKNKFVQIREMILQGNDKLQDIAIKFAVSYPTILSVKNLKHRKHQKWEEERLSQ